VETGNKALSLFHGPVHPLLHPVLLLLPLEYHLSLSNVGVGVVQEEEIPLQLMVVAVVVEEHIADP
jgi:hypothetical protein